MTDKISGYTPEQWCNSENLILVIESEDGGEITFYDHYIYQEPAWPPLESNGDEWYIDEL